VAIHGFPLPWASRADSTRCRARYPLCAWTADDWLRRSNKWREEQAQIEGQLGDTRVTNQQHLDDGVSVCVSWAKPFDANVKSAQSGEWLGLVNDLRNRLVETQGTLGLTVEFPIKKPTRT
jgi:hypothetical protein